jgi:hypothetical protein
MKTTDPLEGIVEEEIRKQLALMRLNAGSVIESERLRQMLKGFRSQKGIYKPSGSQHALWVRETLHGPYPDQEPEVFPDGSWTYRYTPEGRGGHTDMNLDTNKSLLKCIEDRVPVGVLRQRGAEHGAASYEVLGLAYVKDFDGTHFILQGEPIKWEDVPVAGTPIPPFSPFDEKPRPRLETTRQQRDMRFSFMVRQAYHEKCSLCEVGYRFHGRLVGVEAAHIIPVEDRGNTGDVRNGMLLCRNHHTLFDEYAWTPDEDFRVMVADDEEFRESAAANCVMDWVGKKLPNLPSKEFLLPAMEALRYRLRKFEST